MEEIVIDLGKKYKLKPQDLLKNISKLRAKFPYVTSIDLKNISLSIVDSLQDFKINKELEKKLIEEIIALYIDTDKKVSSEYDGIFEKLNTFIINLNSKINTQSDLKHHILTLKQASQDLILEVSYYYESLLIIEEFLEKFLKNNIYEDLYVQFKSLKNNKFNLNKAIKDKDFIQKIDACIKEHEAKFLNKVHKNNSFTFIVGIIIICFLIIFLI